MPLQNSVRTLRKLVAALCVLTWTSVAQATEVPLRNLLEINQTTGSSVDVLEVPNGRGSRSREPWTWLSLTEPNVLERLPERWQLLIDQCRFEELVIIATAHDGTTQRIVRSAEGVQGNWAPGGLLRFTIEANGKQIRSLQIGFKALDDIRLMRKVAAASPGTAMKLGSRWLVLMGMVAGLLVSAFIYNAFIYAGQRSRFLGWYLAWLTASLAYGLTWTNVTAFLIPGAAGPMAVRADYILVGLVVGLGCLFLLSVLEAGKVPKHLQATVRTLGAACIFTGLIASDERLLPARATDTLLNVVLLLSALAIIIALGFAVRRGSRVACLYLIGWTPVILVFMARCARNFGLLAQDDMVDMATFAAIGFESLLFSLATATRFKGLRAERDAAEQLLQTTKIEAKAIQRLALTDHLTGLGNRASFHQQLRTFFASETPFTLILIDLDFLKDVNDRAGHDAGDALLRTVASRLSYLADAHTYVSRIGGDEYAVLAQVDDRRIKRIISSIGTMQGEGWLQNGSSGTISLSIGSARSDKASSEEELFKKADLALYNAKQNGRGHHRIYDARLALQVQNRSELIKEAHAGLSRSEFFLAYQPIVSLKTGQITSEEALLRWHHPRRGTITPATFGQLFTQEEIAPTLQQCVLALALQELKRRGPLAVPLAVNFTALDLRGRASARRLLSTLSDQGILPGSLCIEVTESIILDDGAQGPHVALRLLHEAGVRIALDDFGTGYASLTHLRQLPVDVLKIDRTFVARLLDENESEQIVRAVIALAHGLGKDVIAEGIEHEAQAERLRELGCGYGQGFYFGRPAARHAPDEAADRRGAVA